MGIQSYMTTWDKFYVAVGIIASIGVFAVCSVAAENLEGWIKVLVTVLACLNLMGVIGLAQSVKNKGRKK